MCEWCSVTGRVSGFYRPGSVRRDFWSPDRSPGSRRSLPLAERGGASPPWAGERVVLRKTVSIDERLSRLDRGTKKLRNIHVSSSFGHKVGFGFISSLLSLASQANVVSCSQIFTFMHETALFNDD